VTLDALALRREDDGCGFAVHVRPRARADAVGGLHGTALLVRVRALPVAGQANAAVEALLAEALGLPRGQVAVTAGRRGKSKWVSVRGLAPEAARERLATAAGAG
jgi:uncharacterized protein YggU (UPF0235/DUF167 family)